MRGTRQLRGRRCGGQVLVYVMMILIALLIVIIFLYDLQYFIRLRARTQMAADAAALTAAAWEGRSLNIIGEMNLLKGATVLISDIPPEGDASEAGLLASCALLTEMQTRVTYVGPCLGFAAMQQTAKNNGLREVSDFTESLQSHIDFCFGPGGLYSIYDPVYNNYDWYRGYGDMLTRVAAEGIAVKLVNNHYLSGRPLLEGPGAFLLMNPAFYDAVHANFYCWFYLQGIGPDYNPDFSLVRLRYDSAGYFVGSEYLSLYVDFATGVPDYSAMQSFMDERGLVALPQDQPGLDQLRWAIYVDEAADQGWSQTDNYEAYEDYDYLRSPFKRQYVYGGAAARVFAQTQPSLLSGRWQWMPGRAPEAERPTSVGDALQWSSVDFGGGASFTKFGRQMSNAEQQLSTLREQDTVLSVCSAKPLGALTDDQPPHAVGIVLPVFKDVRLIPTGLVEENAMDRYDKFYRFLVEYFGCPTYPNVPQDIINRWRYYVDAIRWFQDPQSAFRQGWWTFDAWRETFMAGPDGLLGTADDVRDPCLPPPPQRVQPNPPPGGPGPGGPGVPVRPAPPSRGGPPLIH